jgi:hypothetical protein
MLTRFVRVRCPRAEALTAVEITTDWTVQPVTGSEDVPRRDEGTAAVIVTVTQATLRELRRLSASDSVAGMD